MSKKIQISDRSVNGAKTAEKQSVLNHQRNNNIMEDDCDKTIDQDECDNILQEDDGDVDACGNGKDKNERDNEDLTSKNPTKA